MQQREHPGIYVLRQALKTARRRAEVEAQRRVKAGRAHWEGRAGGIAAALQLLDVLSPQVLPVTVEAVRARREEYLENLPHSWTGDTGRLTLETLRTEQAAELAWVLGREGAADGE